MQSIPNRLWSLLHIPVFSWRCFFDVLYPFNIRYIFVLRFQYPSFRKNIRGHIGGAPAPSPLSNTMRAFTARIFRHHLPPSNRVELYIPTLLGASCGNALHNKRSLSRRLKLAKSTLVATTLTYRRLAGVPACAPRDKHVNESHSLRTAVRMPEQKKTFVQP